LLSSLDNWLDRDRTEPAAILEALEIFERELIKLGGAPEPELAEAVSTIERRFPGARLIYVRRKPTKSSQ
jgi:hypothetical protein